MPFNSYNNKWPNNNKWGSTRNRPWLVTLLLVVAIAAIVAAGYLIYHFVSNRSDKGALKPASALTSALTSEEVAQAIQENEGAVDDQSQIYVKTEQPTVSANAKCEPLPRAKIKNRLGTHKNKFRLLKHRLPHLTGTKSSKGSDKDPSNFTTYPPWENPDLTR